MCRTEQMGSPPIDRMIDSACPRVVPKNSISRSSTSAIPLQWSLPSPADLRWRDHRAGTLYVDLLSRPCRRSSTGWNGFLRLCRTIRVRSANQNAWLVHANCVRMQSGSGCRARARPPPPASWPGGSSWSRRRRSWWRPTSTGRRPPSSSQTLGKQVDVGVHREDGTKDVVALVRRRYRSRRQGAGPHGAGGYRRPAPDRRGHDAGAHPAQGRGESPTRFSSWPTG